MTVAMTPTAQSLLISAVSHTASAEVLREAGKPDSDNGTYSASMWFLMGWAVELLLKSAILHFGGSDADCRKAGHDLFAALTDATNRGYASREQNLPNLVRDLAPTHQTHFFRYLPEGNTEVPGDSALALAVVKAAIYEMG